MADLEQPITMTYSFYAVCLHSSFRHIDRCSFKALITFTLNIFVALLRLTKRPTNTDRKCLFDTFIRKHYIDWSKCVAIYVYQQWAMAGYRPGLIVKLQDISRMLHSGIVFYIEKLFTQNTYLLKCVAL